MSEEQRVQDTELESNELEEESQEDSWQATQNDPPLQPYATQAQQKTEEDHEAYVANDVDQQSDHTDSSPDLQSLDLRFVLDIPLQVTVELGRKRILIQDLLKLNHGAVIELTKQVSEPLDVLVNQKLIARGEVVVVNDKFGVRLTDIISPKERLRKIQ